MSSLNAFLLLVPVLPGMLVPAGPDPSAEVALDVYDTTTLTTSLGNWQAEPIELWLATQPVLQPFRARVMAHSGPDLAPTFIIMMEEGLYDQVGDTLMTSWMVDMTSEGHVVEAVEVTYSSVSEIRDYLTSAWEQGLEGVVLVGDLPVPLSVFEWEGVGNETFPSDYYFMDLDGIWEDNWIGYPSAGNPGSDGKFDGWSGELDPEIYAARIKTSNLQGDEVGLIQGYIERTCDWRDDGDPHPVTALCYVDDDWAAWGAQYQSAMQLVYEDVELVNRNDQTNGQDYRTNRLPGDYVWISPYVHSSPTAHYFQPGPVVYWSDVAAINPPAHFFNLFACSNCRFITANYMGGTYAFVNTNGLAAVGSCKAGSMLRFSYFYGPIGEGGSLGDGYREWWDEIALGGFTGDEIGWHLGMVLLGDPTLMPTMHMLGIEEEEESRGGSGTEPDLPVATLSLSPNPSSGEFSAHWSLAGGAALEVRDLSGRLLDSGDIVQGEQSAVLGDPGLPAGVYVVTARNNAGQSGSALLTVLGESSR